MTISLLSKFKPSTYFLKLEEDWIIFSHDAPELKLLEKIVSEDEAGNIGIKLTKRNGIHPSENEAVKELHEVYLSTAKTYFDTIKAISEETGLSPADVTSRSNQDLVTIKADVLEAITKAKESGLDYDDLQSELEDLQYREKKDAKAIAEMLSPYNARYNEAQEAHIKGYDNYYVGLIAHFLSGQRTDTKVSFTIDNVKNLHSGLRNALATFITNEINGWAPAGKD